jgi:hypothetical protein
MGKIVRLVLLGLQRGFSLACAKQGPPDFNECLGFAHVGGNVGGNSIR